MLLLLNPLRLVGMLFVAFGAAGPLVAAADATTIEVNPSFYTEDELDYRNLSSRNLKSSKKGSKQSKISKSTKSTRAPTSAPTPSCVAGSTGVFVTRADGASEVVEVSKLRPGDKIRGMDVSLNLSNECEVIANDGE
jgi:hypothetical protein